MFYPHCAEIRRKRREPEEKILKEEAELFRRSRAKIVNRAVLNFFTNLARKPGATTKLFEAERVEDRKKELDALLATWNKWRRFYFHLPPQEIKTKSEVTILEKIKAMIDSNGHNADLFLACTMKAYAWGRFRPAFAACLSRGEEFFDRYCEDVRADIEKDYYEEGAST